MSVAGTAGASRLAQAQRQDWRIALPLLVCAWAAMLTLFARDASAMATTWWTSSTYEHCLLIVPVIGWLVWQQRGALAQMTPRGWWPALAWVGLGAFGWLLGQAGGLAVARQLGLILMLQGATVAIVGPAVGRAMAFPLFYLFFLVPIGDEAVPALQTLTARITMRLLDWWGIAAHIDGIFITTPRGYFKVAEACSGVKFLVAMLALGVLVAHLCFTRWRRRIAFLALCVAVPIVANGIRAFGTIAIAQRTGVAFASGFDHVFYGWVFFALVIALVIGASWRFFDRAPDAPTFDPLALAAADGGRHRIGTSSACAAALGVSLIAPAWSALVAARPVVLPAAIAAPAVAGWRQVPVASDWTGHFAGASLTGQRRYRDARGRSVDLFIAVFDRQSEGRELVGYGRGAVGPDRGVEGDWAWTASRAPIGPGRFDIIEAAGPRRRVVATYYALGGRVTGSSLTVKLATMRANLLGTDPRGYAILVSCEGPSDAATRAAVTDFVAAIGPIDRYADQLKGR